MPTLILTVGLPRSGKSTWAAKHGAPVVCPDSIRLALHGQRHCPSAEPIVWATARLMVDALFLSGHETVIVDATNVRKAWRDQWKSDKYEVVLHVNATGAAVCQERAIATNQPDLVPVIARMFNDLYDHENIDDMRSYRWVD